MHKESYRTGKWVGLLLAAARNASEFCSTWPEDALEEDKNEIIEWGKIHGMDVLFKDRSVNFTRPKPEEEPPPEKPKLTLVN